jgi:methylase of polypeptide subunit release factors
MNINPKSQFIDSTRELINTPTASDTISIDGLTFQTHPEVFNPNIFFSSVWFAREVAQLVQYEKTFIEVGCGTGIVSILVASKSPELEVYSTDINPHAEILTRQNTEVNGASERIRVYCGDVLDAIPRNIQANSIFWSMPFGFLPPEEYMEGRDIQVFDPGYRAIRKFFADAPKHLVDDGRLLIGFSKDIGHYELLESIAIEHHFSLKLLTQTKGVEKDSVSMEIYEAKLVS